MQLLVSVRNAAEALAALVGGADIIDAKDPAAGALGAVSLPTFASITHCVPGTVPVSAALGEAGELDLDERVGAFGRTGAAFVKIGFARLARGEVAALLAAASTAGSASGTAVVAVAYADWPSVDSLCPDTIVDLAVAGKVSGLLLDTADKAGPGLFGLLSEPQIGAWVHRVQSAGMFAALAGQVEATDMARICSTGADIVGVRGAACDNGRGGAISAGRVRQLSGALQDPMQRRHPIEDRLAVPARNSRQR